MSVLVIVLMIVGPFVILWAKEKEASLPQCDECGPMYFGEHDSKCSQVGGPLG